MSDTQNCINLGVVALTRNPSMQRERETLEPQVRVQAHGQGEVGLCSWELTGALPTGLPLQGLCVMSATNDIQA